MLASREAQPGSLAGVPGRALWTRLARLCLLVTDLPGASGTREPARGRPRAGGSRLLDLDGGARGLELRLDVVRLVLRDVLHHDAAGLDQVLGLLEAEVGDGAHLLDDLELLVARAR